MEKGCLTEVSAVSSGDTVPSSEFSLENEVLCRFLGKTVGVFPRFHCGHCRT